MRFYTLLICAILISNSFAADRHALIVAVGDYLPETKWGNISSINDVQIIREALLLRGFKSENIHVVSHKVTKDSIVNAIDHYLIKPVKMGDMALFHFSGHGQQIEDDNGDETDGLDEALVPYDAPLNNFTTDAKGAKLPYDFKKHLRDDELGVKLDGVRKALGSQGNLLVVIDACHSGTSTRGIGPARGTAKANVSDKFDPSKFKLSERSDFGLTKTNDELANMVCFFGSSQNELNYEYHPDENSKYGSLSFAMSKTLAEADNNASYRSFFDKLRREMAAIAPLQSPQVEGLLDQIILGGNLLAKPVYWQTTKWIKTTEVQINAGKLMALYPGSIVAFYPPDTRDITTVTPWAIGKVVSSRTADAKVQITSGVLSKDTALLSWCYPLEKNFGDMAVKLKLVTASDKIRTQIMSALAEYPFIQLADSNVDILFECGEIEGKKSSELRLTTSSDHIKYNQPIQINRSTNLLEQEQVNTTIRKIISFAQARFLRGLEVINPSLNVSIEFVPMALKPGSSGDNPYQDFIEIDSSTIRDVNGGLRIKENTYIKIRVRNASSKTLYFSLIDIMPDDELYVMFPEEGRTKEEYKVQGFATNENTGSVFKIGPPYGSDQLMLIVSKKPIDLQSIASTRGEGETKGTASSFEKVFQNSFKENKKSRGVTSVPVEVEDIGVYRFPFQIVPEVN